MNEKYYIRIGEVPNDEKSIIFKNGIRIGEESGVSVYNTILNFQDGRYHIVMPSPFKEGQGRTYECLIQQVTQYRLKIGRPRKIYLVIGDEVGKGSDGEPLLRNVKVIKDITKDFYEE